MSLQNDFSLNAGDTKVIRVILRDSNKVAVDLSNASIVWKAAKHVTSTVLISKSLSSGIQIISATEGIFEITISAADTVNLGGKTLYHEAKVQLASDNSVATVLSGDMIVEKSLVQDNI